MVPFIAVVVSEFHDGFEAVQVLNPVGGDVMVVPFPVMLAVSSAEMVPEARPELPRLGACVGEEAVIVEPVFSKETLAVSLKPFDADSDDSSVDDKLPMDALLPALWADLNRFEPLARLSMREATETSAAPDLVLVSDEIVDGEVADSEVWFAWSTVRTFDATCWPTCPLAPLVSPQLHI